MLGTLMHKALACAKQNDSRSLLFCFGFNKTHFRALCRDDNSLSVCCVILLALDERLYILRRDQFYLMAHLAQCLSPMMSAAAGLHNDNRRFLSLHK